MNKIDALLALPSAKYRYLMRLLIEKQPRRNQGFSSQVEVTFHETFSPESSRLHIIFFDVSTLQVGNLDATAACLITVRDISKSGMEGISYRVTEEEAGTFSLNCRDFDFNVVS